VVVIAHLLTDLATITDVSRTPGVGGAVPETKVIRASGVKCRRFSVTARDIEIAYNWGASATAKVYFLPDEMVEVGDELAIGDRTYTVKGLLPETIYLKVLVEEHQPGA
jgi:hypothetical protein